MNALRIQEQIPTESALKLRSRLARKFKPPWRTGILVLEQALHVAALYLASLSAPKDLTNQRVAWTGLRPGDFLEIHGPAASGKSVLLEAAIARTVIPEWGSFDIPELSEHGIPQNGDPSIKRPRRTQDGQFENEHLQETDATRNRNGSGKVWIGGRNRRALVIDLSPRGIDLERLEKQIAAYLYCAYSQFTKKGKRTATQAEQIPVDETVLRRMVLNSLSRVHVIRPQNSEQLLVHLARLPVQLANLPGPPVELLAVEEAGGFHWEDRVEEKALGLGLRENYGNGKINKDRSPRDPGGTGNTARALGRTLKSLAEELGAVVMATTGAIWEGAAHYRNENAHSESIVGSYKDHMPINGWRDQVTHRIVTANAPYANKRDRPPDEEQVMAGYHEERTKGCGKCVFGIVRSGGVEINPSAGRTVMRMANDGNDGKDWFEFQVAEYGIAMGS